MSALVASVVPWISERTSAARLPASLSTVTTPCSTAWEGSLGVVRSLPTWTAPVASSTHTRSVKVPPMSTPMRVRREEGGVMAPECHGAPAGSRQRQPRFYDREERETGRGPSAGAGVRSSCVTHSPCMLDKGSGDGSPLSPRSSRPGFSLVPRLLFQRVNPNSRQGGKARIDKDGTWDRFL